MTVYYFLEPDGIFAMVLLQQKTKVASEVKLPMAVKREVQFQTPHVSIWHTYQVAWFGLYVLASRKVFGGK